MNEQKAPSYYDNTRVSAYKTCPRYFYLRHIRHWNPDRTGIALVNGSAWHAAMDIVWSEIGKKRNRNDQDVLQKALALYIHTWVEEGLPAPEDMSMEQMEAYYPRGPHIAAEVLMNYILQRRRFIEDGEVVAIEQPFAVPLYEDNNELLYIGRLDKVFRSRTQGLCIIEHKSSSDYAKESGFKSRWVDSFSPNSQVDGYSYAANILYDNLKSVMIDGALFHKTVHDKFKMFPVDRHFNLLETWLHETRQWIARIEDDKARLKRTGNLGSSFPKNTNACGNYAGCSMRNICRYTVDPSNSEVPPGFVEREWNPFDILKIGELGLLPERKESYSE